MRLLAVTNFYPPLGYGYGVVCQDVMRGQKLVVDMTTGVSRMDGGRVEGLFNREREGGSSPPAQSRPPRTN